MKKFKCPHCGKIFKDVYKEEGYTVRFTKSGEKVEEFVRSTYILDCGHGDFGLDEIVFESMSKRQNNE